MLKKIKVVITRVIKFFKKPLLSLDTEHCEGQEEVQDSLGGFLSKLPKEKT